MGQGKKAETSQAWKSIAEKQQKLQAITQAELAQLQQIFIQAKLRGHEQLKLRCLQKRILAT